MNIKVLCKSLALSVATVLATFPTALLAAEPVPPIVNKEAQTSATTNQVGAYWTPERIRNAKSLDIPKPASNFQPLPLTSQTQGASITSPGAAPSVKANAEQTKLFEPLLSGVTTNQSSATPNNVGTLGAYFTSSRLIPLTADQSYPYSMVGKLFFTIPGKGDYVCSASVIRSRLILTAGHCMHSGNGSPSGYYNNWLFVPAYRDGAAPYKVWTYTGGLVTGPWYYGGGSVPNSADFGVLVLSDQPFYGTYYRIGDIVGYFGYQTNRLSPNHATLLGYPGNLDNGEIMHQVTAGSYSSGGNNTVLYGSDMGGGSSGGPWVQNFGSPAAGQTYGNETGSNRVIGVTSYGSTSPTPLYEGSSILNNDFITLINWGCGLNKSNC